MPGLQTVQTVSGERRVPYNWVDIDQDEESRWYVLQVNDGKQIIPTIVLEDGSILVEPTNAELAAKLEVRPRMESRLQATVEESRGNGHLESLVDKDMATDATEKPRPAAAFIFIVLNPNTDFLGRTVKRTTGTS